MKKNNQSNPVTLRQKAETLLEKKTIKSVAPTSEIDTLKLIHELEVHQIELEMQNQELVAAKLQAELVTEKYTNLFDFAPIGYITLSRNNEILELNFCAANMLGKERSHLITNRFDLFVSVDTRLNLISFLERIFTSNKKEICEVKLIKDENSLIYVFLTGIISEDNQQCSIMLTDITSRIKAEEERKKYTIELEAGKTAALNLLEDLTAEIETRKITEQRLIESEKKYRALIETTGTGYLILDHEGKVIDANKEYVRLTGHSELNEITGRSIMEWTAEYETKKNALAIKQCLEKGFVRNLVIDYADQKENIIPVEINATVQREKNSLQIISLCRDISDRRLAEIKLQESKDYLDKIINAVASPIFVKDSDHKFLLVNNALCSLLNLMPEQLIGHTGYEHFPEEQMKIFLSMDNEVFLSGTENINEELISVAHGKVQTIITRKTLYTDASGKKFLVGVINDITDRKQAEDAIRQKINELEEFNDLMVGRENKMVELKDEINALLIKAGMPAKYKIVTGNE